MRLRADRIGRAPGERYPATLPGKPAGPRAGCRFGEAGTGKTDGVRVVPRWLSPKTLLNPISRAAIAAFAWQHRHEILRWGRTLYDQVIGRSETSPARAMRTSLLLYSIASDERLRDAKQLKKVSLVGSEVDLVVDDRWSELPRLVDRVRNVKGVDAVTVNGRRVGLVRIAS